MCNCDLDPVNFCCWEHGTDITMEDYVDDCCGACDETEMYDDEEFYHEDE